MTLRKVKAIIIISLAVVAVVLIQTGCRNGCFLYTQSVSFDSETENSARLPQVRVIDLGKAKGNRLEMTLTGVVEPQARVSVTSLVSGQVVEILAETGYSARAGQTFAVLDSPEIATAFANAATQLNTAQENVLNTRIITDTQVSQAELSVQNAELGLQLANDSEKNMRDSYAQDLAVLEKSVESAKIQFHQAAADLETTRVQISQSEETQLNKAQILQNSQSLFVDNMRAEIDQFLDDQAIISALSAKDQQLKIQTIDNAKDLLDKIDLYQIQKTAITVQNNVAQLKNTRSVFQKIHETISLIIGSLNQSVSNSSLSPENLAALKAAYNGFEAQATSGIQSIEGLLSSLLETELQNTSLLQNMMLAKNQAEIAYLNAQSGYLSGKAKLDTALAHAQTGALQARNSLQTAQKALSSVETSQDVQMMAVRSNLANAQAQYDLAKIRKDNLTLQSPISGVITDRMVEMGQEVNPSQTLFEVQNDETLKITVEADEKTARRISAGDEVVINGSLTGVVYQTDPALNEQSKKATIKILYTGKREALTLGSLAKVTFPITITNGASPIPLLVPLKSVIIGDGESMVKVVEDGKVAVKTGVLGDVHGQYVEVLSGLKRDALVIVEGGALLQDGAEVEISNL